MRLRRIFHTVFSALLCLPFAFSGVPAQEMGTAALITPDHLQTIYRHILENHYVPQTGLFASFPDSGDRKVSQQASTYEQGAIGLLALRLGDVERARGVYRFLRKAWMDAPTKSDHAGRHGLANFYNAYFGTDGIEKAVHVGPNAWSGLLAARLGNETHDAEATQWALDIAYWIANSVPHENGAVAMATADERGGAPWAHVFSTENNLSYYAFLTELLRCPRLERSQRVAITQERDRLENWLINTAFDRGSYRIVRGISPQGIDKMQALDTTTWFISAIGPQRLAERGIDPFQLMRKIQETFEARVANHFGVDATDQAEADFVYLHAQPQEASEARPANDQHRLLWYEGLGQYILAWTTLAEFAERQGKKDLASQLMAKARHLTEAFDHAALPRYAGRGAYPYATPGKFFRDGWHAPAAGSDGPASSLIAATWRCFAGLGIDPVAGRDLSNVQHAHLTMPSVTPLAARALPVLYGTSEEMTARAWQTFNDGQWDQTLAQARATIQEWQPWATKLQAQKMAEVGHLVDYSGEAEEKKTVFKYWALNDVAACYFMIGKALDEKNEHAQAAQAFQQIVNHYSLAQIWDSRGWFWSPVEAISNDYVLRDPDHYGNIIPKVLAEGSSIGKHPN